MTAQLPIQGLINVDVNLSQTVAQAQSLNNLLVLGSSNVIDVNERMRNYSTVAQVASEFGENAPEYYAALTWFAQSPQPINFSIGRWAKTDTNGVLVGAPIPASSQIMSTWTAITTGAFHIAVNGGSLTEVGPINFNTCTNLNAVASHIQSALTAVSINTLVTWNPTYQNFQIQSATTGTSSAVSFLTAPSSGVDIGPLLGLTATSSGCYSVDGIAAETAVSALSYFENNFGQKWYGGTVLGATDADHIACASFIEAATTKHLYFVTHNEAGVLVASDTSNLSYQLKQLGLKRTISQYSSTNAYAVISFAARLITVDYTQSNSVLTMMYKQEPTIIAENINQTQLTALTANNCNAFVAYNNGATIVQNGVVASGDFCDIITGTDWLALDLQNRLFNRLYSSETKIQQTDPGNGILKADLVAGLDDASNNGLVAPGVWHQGGFGQIKTGDYLNSGYYVYQPLTKNQNPTDREARKAVAFQVAACLAGAIHTANVMLNIQR